MFLTIPYETRCSFPKTVGNRFLGRPGPYLRGRTCVSSAKAYNAAAGLSKEGWVARLVLCAPGIVLTWAAKPKVRSVPLTLKTFLENLASFAESSTTLSVTLLLIDKFRCLSNRSEERRVG